MSKIRLLLLSSFASGFGLCSIILAMLTMISALSFTSFFIFVLTLIFFGINMLFAMHYYTSITKQLSVKGKRKARIER
jgi:hypothetical protein